jgi:hypothetical protein
MITDVVNDAYIKILSLNNNRVNLRVSENKLRFKIFVIKTLVQQTL